MSLKEYSPLLRKWHVRIGLSTALILLGLSITGLLINHSTQLKFGNKTLPIWLASWSYVVAESPLQTLDINSIRAQSSQGNLRVSGVADTAPSLDRQTCTGSLIGATEYASEIWFACEQEISLYLQTETNGTFIEQLNAYSGLPSPIDRFGLCEQVPCIASAEQIYLYMAENNQWRVSESNNLETNWSPSPRTELNRSVPEELNWDRWLLDLHAGRLFGGLGVWLVDITGIAVVLLVFSGFLRWFSTRERSK